MLAPSPGQHGNALARNPGMGLELDWVRHIRVNLSAAEFVTAIHPRLFGDRIDRSASLAHGSD